MAKSAGFCFGVERAVKAAYDAAENKDLPVYSFGPIVHNDEVIRELRDKGVQIVESETELETLPKGIVLIRAHGITRALQEKLNTLGFQIIDATCPFVKKIHKIVDESSFEGMKILIIGDKNHPEVQGITGWSNSPVFVLKEPEEAENIPFSVTDSVKVVIQTTFQQKKCKNILEKIKTLGYNAIIADTICNATRERQLEADRISAISDVVIVIGGEHSSNSRRLYEICKNNCDHTYFIQTAKDLMPGWFLEAKTVGITAGASTPKNIITEVQTICQNLNKC